jgi:hypothetical protein
MSASFTVPFAVRSTEDYDCQQKGELLWWANVITVFWLYVSVHNDSAFPGMPVTVMKSEEELDKDGLDI